ncbi:MAG TPA: CHRD domain-containing protein [Gaiellaceae bacterium]|nr:CHRD domain-containing protein [Gaiellaceae bacterium]
MRTRLVGFLFIVGMAVVGTAVAGLNANWSTHASGSLEVPPRATSAQGQAIFHLSADASELEYELIASNIENVVASHIHVGVAGANGPIGVFLYGTAAPGAGRTDGVLAEGTITAANLIGPLAGMSLADLVQLMNSGGAYVNVHTNDGVGDVNTGPGDFPGGEIRGDIK